MSIYLAKFDENGKCVGVIESPVHFGGDWVEVNPGTSPDELYRKPNGEIVVRQNVEINLSRRVYAADGVDGPNVASDATLEFIGPIHSSEPTSALVQAVGAFYSEPIIYRFDTLEALKEEAAQNVDAAAGAERLKHITDQPGQATIYAAKLAEAKAYGSVPQVYVSSEAEALEIITRAAECDAALALIEAQRFADKQTISNADSALELWSRGYVE